MADEWLTSDLLARSLEECAQSFAPGELAFLALTSKVELPVRDRLAWALHTKLPGKIVAREWKRVDLAVLDSTGTRPEALIEAKAMYTFDFANPESRTAGLYPRLVAEDVAKAHKLSQGMDPAPAVFALVLVTHPLREPPRIPGVIKYLTGIRSASRYGDPAVIRDLAASHLDLALRHLGPVVNGELDAGSAFNTPTAIGYWIVGPVTPSH